MNGNRDALFVLLALALAGLAAFTLAGLWARSVLRRHWARNTGCPACTWMDGGRCACTVKCASPECKGARR